MEGCEGCWDVGCIGVYKLFLFLDYFDNDIGI